MNKFVTATFSIIAMGIALSSAAEAAPGWCHRGVALNPTEATICDSYRLRKLDDRLTAAYKRALRDSFFQYGKIRKMQRRWVSSRNQCGLHGHCIEGEYHDQIRVLASYFTKTNNEIRAQCRRILQLCRNGSRWACGRLEQANNPCDRG